MISRFILFIIESLVCLTPGLKYLENICASTKELIPTNTSMNKLQTCQCVKSHATNHGASLGLDPRSVT